MNNLEPLANSAPVLARELPIRYVGAGQSLDFAFGANAFTDPDGDPLRYKARSEDGSALPEWISFDPDTRTFTLSPQAADVGYHFLRITAADPSSASARGFIGFNVISGLVLRGSAAGEEVTGTIGDDTIDGGRGADTLDGGGGRDTLDGGADADLLIGGAGDDYYVLTPGDQVIELENGGRNDYAYTESSWTMSAGVESLYIAGSARIDAVGNELDNWMLCWPPNRWELVLRAEGLGGNDTILGANRPDTISGGDGTDVLDGGAGADLLSGGAGPDRMLGRGSADSLRGAEGQDDLAGGGGDDQLTGGAGDDLLHGAGGLDVLSGGKGSDRLQGGRDADELDAGRGKDELAGDEGRDLLIGGEGGDALGGGSGSDVLLGGAGRDRLYGGPGPDVLTGGADADVFGFGAPLRRANSDTVSDFQSGADRIALSAMAFSDLVAGEPLTADQFLAADGANAGTIATHRIVYDTASGALYYDADGSGAGAAVQFAVLSGAVALTIADFTVTH